MKIVLIFNSYLIFLFNSVNTVNKNDLVFTVRMLSSELVAELSVGIGLFMPAAEESHHCPSGISWWLKRRMVFIAAVWKLMKSSFHSVYINYSQFANVKSVTEHWNYLGSLSGLLHCSTTCWTHCGSCVLLLKAGVWSFDRQWGKMLPNSLTKVLSFYWFSISC